MVLCQDGLKEGLGTMALHVRCIYVRAEGRGVGRGWVSLTRFTNLCHVAMWGLPKHIYLESFPLLLGRESTLCSEQGFPLRSNTFYFTNRKRQPMHSNQPEKVSGFNLQNGLDT